MKCAPLLKPSTLVLGQNQNAQIQSKENTEQKENKQKQDAQALFEESLRQLMPLSNEKIQEYRTHSDKRERALLPISPDLNSPKWKSILHK